MYKGIARADRIEHKPNIFAIGDIHGEYKLLMKLLAQYKPDTEQLVLIGDLLDKGPNSKSVLLECYYRSQDRYNPPVVLRGNHEELFLDFLKYPAARYDSYIVNGGGYTLCSLVGETYTMTNTPETIARRIKEQYADEIAFLEDCPVYYRRNNLLFVHAGVNLSFADFRQSDDQDFTWIRKQFQENTNQIMTVNKETGIEEPLKIIHGHTPNPVAPAFTQNKVNIDGGATFGGALVGVKFNVWGDVIEAHKVNKTLELQGSEL